MKLRDSLATDIKPGYAFMLNREKQAFWVQDFVVKAHDQGPQEQDEWVLLCSRRRGIRCQVGPRQTHTGVMGARNLKTGE